MPKASSYLGRVLDFYFEEKIRRKTEKLSGRKLDGDHERG
jgi:hypothetical protein